MMSEGGNPSRYVKLTKEQAAPTEDIRPGELNQPIDVPQVAEGATALYMEQLRGIHYITERGAQQLSVDIEYLSNVLSALSMPIPPILATYHTCLSTPRDQLKELLKSDSEESELDPPTANLVCKMRRVSLE